jgi:Proprotein convertase P-domain
MRYSFQLLAVALLSSGFSQTALAQRYYPIRNFSDESTGLLESYVGNDGYRGSGVIARDPRLIFSCAHLFFEKGKWATDFYFTRAWHNETYPTEEEGVSPRGLNYFTSYSSGVKSDGSESAVAFASDFTVLYGNSAFGPAKGAWANGGSVLKSNRLKRILGYPAEIDFNGSDGFYYQHATESFTNEGYRVYGSFYDFENVSTGSGNSGGPIFVQDEVTGNELLAGILVSGTKKSAGVVALDLSTDSLASYALGLKNKTLTFRNTTKLSIPDGKKSYSTNPIEVSGFSGTTSKLKFSMKADTKRRGDLDVFLRSPSGRVRWISKHGGGNGVNLNLSNKNFTADFTKSSPNGTWQLKVRDIKAGNRATLTSYSLEISAL